MNISVLGCGRWGSCIAWYLDKIGNNVISCGLADAPEFIQLSTTHKNDYLTFPESIEVTSDLAKAVNHAEQNVLAREFEARVSIGDDRARDQGEEHADDRDEERVLKEVGEIHPPPGLGNAVQGEVRGPIPLKCAPGALPVDGAGSGIRGVDEVAVFPPFGQERPVPDPIGGRNLEYWQDFPVVFEARGRGRIPWRLAPGFGHLAVIPESGGQHISQRQQKGRDDHAGHHQHQPGSDHASRLAGQGGITAEGHQVGICV